jgi:hypothetical protein
MAITHREKQIVQRFLPVYNRFVNEHFDVSEWPDDVDRTNKRVDALATGPSNSRLAIEHTLLEPFAGERYDTNVFVQAVAPLHMKASLISPGVDVSLYFHVGAIPKGVRWPDVPAHIEAWYGSVGVGLPFGRTTVAIPSVSFDLQAVIDKEAVVGAGHFFVERWMPEGTLLPTVRRALAHKLGKLATERANRRVLLLEKNTWPWGYVAICEAIEALRFEYADLSVLDHAWVINTCALETDDYSPSYLVWPATEKLAFDLKRHGA